MNTGRLRVVPTVDLLMCDITLPGPAGRAVAAPPNPAVGARRPNSREADVRLVGVASGRSLVREPVSLPPPRTLNAPPVALRGMDGWMDGWMHSSSAVQLTTSQPASCVLRSRCAMP